METFELLTKKRKRKNRLITVGLSILAICGLYIGVRMITERLISNKAWTVVHTVELLESVAYPNSTTYTWSANGGDMFHGGIKGSRAKDIYGVPVYDTTYENHFSLFGGEWGGTVLDYRTGYDHDGKLLKLETNQKIPQFYNINAQKQSEGELIATPTQELPLVKKMENQLVEVAITLDKPYTLDDINSMIPSNLKTNWYWIGTTSKGDSSTWSMYSLYGTDAQGFTREEYVDEQAAHNALKESAKEGGQPDQEAMATKAVDAFLTNLKAVLEAPGDTTYNTTRPRDDIEKYLEKFGHLDLTKEEDRNKLEFSGIILTGRAEDFAQLENADWIYASSIGASIPNQPYYTLSQE